jgi:hypothetical protein
MEVVPVALITEINDAVVSDNFVCSALGEAFMSFRTRVVQLSRTQAEDWADSKNLVAQTLLMAMAGQLPRAKRLSALLEFFVQYDEDETRLLFPLFTQVGKFTEEEHAMTIKYLTQLPKPLFMTMLEEQSEARGMERGARAKALEAATKMREHGISWEIIASATGIKPEDLEAA